jgi:hypothetical protein
MGFNWKELDRYEVEQQEERERRPSREKVLLEKKRNEVVETQKVLVFNSYLVFGFYAFILARATGVFDGGFTWSSFLTSLAAGAGVGILLFFRRHKAGRQAAEETEVQPENTPEEFPQAMNRHF